MEFLNWKVTIAESYVEVKTTFSKRVLFSNQIRGYRELPYGFILEANDEGLKPLKIGVYTNDNTALVTTITSLFRDLDRIEEEQADEELRNDFSLGENEVARVHTMGNYILLARVLAVVTFIVFVFMLRFDVLPYAMVIPFACYWLIIKSRGRINIELKKGKGNESISLALIISGAIVGLDAAMHTPDLVSWTPLIPFYIAAFGIMFAPLVLIVRKYFPVKNSVWWFVMFGIVSALPFGIGASIYVNSHLNKPELKGYYSIVSNKHIDSGKQVSYHIGFLPVGMLRSNTEFEVSASKYNDFAIGDTVKVIFGKGALGAEWYYPF